MLNSNITVKCDKNAIVFIDGNNFYHNVRQMKVKPSFIDFSKLSELVSLNFGCNRKKTIYYNSIPNIKDGKQVYWAHIKFLEDLKKLPNFEVKTRKLQRTSTAEQLQGKKEIITSLGLCENCKPLVEANCSDCIGNIKTKEKGIDVMIAVDMLEKSVIKKECDCCILISGDADFVPAMNIIKNNGTEVFSSSLTKGYSYELRKNFDFLVLSRNLILSDCLKD